MSWHLQIIQVSYRKKNIDKVIVDNIKEAWVKEKEEKWAKKLANAQGATIKVVQKTANRIANAKFVDVWSTTMVSQIGNWFHRQIQASYHAHPLGYISVNLGFGIEAQHITRQLAITRRRENGRVLPTFHPPNLMVLLHHLNPFHAFHPLYL